MADENLQFIISEIANLQARLMELEGQVRDTERGTADENPFGLPGREQDFPHRWRVALEPIPALLTIGAGSWRRNGVRLNWAEAVPAGSWNVGANYITAVLDDPEEPTALTVEIKAAEPTVEDGSQKVVAIVTCDALVVTDIVQTQFSDIDDTWAATPVATDLELYYNGVLSNCVLPSPQGMNWFVVGVGGANRIYMELKCAASMSEQPGNCPASTTLPMMDPATGNPIATNFVNGLWPAGAGTVLSLMMPETGITETYTVRADGSLDGPAGVVGVLDPASGVTNFYRISSSGRLEQ